MSSEYTLFIGNKNYSSWSLRAWALLRELEIPFEEHLVPFPEHGKYEAFRAFSPTGRVPCLHVGSQRIWDTLAITEFVAEQHPSVWPADATARAWARSAAAEMHSGFGEIRNRCPMNCGLRIRLDSPPGALLAEFQRIDELWTEGLTRFGGPFLAGASFAAVDAFFLPVAFRVRTYGVELTPPAAKYASHLLTLASAREWETAALAEAWREPAHEQEALSAGTLLEDLRTRGPEDSSGPR